MRRDKHKLIRPLQISHDFVRALTVMNIYVNDCHTFTLLVRVKGMERGNGNRIEDAESAGLRLLFQAMSARMMPRWPHEAHCIARLSLQKLGPPRDTLHRQPAVPLSKILG